MSRLQCRDLRVRHALYDVRHRNHERAAPGLALVARHGKVGPVVRAWPQHVERAGAVDGDADAAEQPGVAADGAGRHRDVAPGGALVVAERDLDQPGWVGRQGGAVEREVQRAVRPDLLGLLELQAAGRER